MSLRLLHIGGIVTLWPTIYASSAVRHQVRQPLGRAGKITRKGFRWFSERSGTGSGFAKPPKYSIMRTWTVFKGPPSGGPKLLTLLTNKLWNSCVYTEI